VDDPSQRTDVQDESSRLRKRVAELEGVIREVCLIVPQKTFEAQVSITVEEQTSSTLGSGGFDPRSGI
jgi:hypothetical protein